MQMICKKPVWSIDHIGVKVATPLVSFVQKFEPFIPRDIIRIGFNNWLGTSFPEGNMVRKILKNNYF
jgi:hypothetical protein